jgi:hypothetical protein
MELGTSILTLQELMAKFASSLRGNFEARLEKKWGSLEMD